MDAHELEARIAAFPRWHYRFEFEGGIATPTPDPSFANRHEQRRRYFFEPLLQLFGGTLSGRRVLDLGCNAGMFSLLAHEAGADFVLGVDARELFVEQAKLVFAAKDIDPSRYRFEVADVFDWEPPGTFELVLCLGLLDHVAKPLELFELISRVGAQTVVIDTEISRARSSVFEVSSLYDRQAVIDYPLVLIPSRQAVLELADQFGYETVALAQNMTDYTGLADYRDQRRLAFLCSRSQPLHGRVAESRPSFAPWWVAALKNSRRRARS